MGVIRNKFRVLAETPEGKEQSKNLDIDGKTILNFVRFQVLTASSMKFRFVFWDVLPCKIIVDRRFRGTCCLHHQDSLITEAVSTSETSVCFYETDDGGSTYL
jgi:hypothetical protein